SLISCLFEGAGQHPEPDRMGAACHDKGVQWMLSNKKRNEASCEKDRILFLSEITLDLSWSRTPVSVGRTPWRNGGAQARRPEQDLSPVWWLAVEQAPTAAPGLPHYRA